MKQIWPPAWLKEGQEFNPNALLEIDDSVQKAQKEKAKALGEKMSKGWKDLIGKGGAVESDDSSDDGRVEGAEDEDAETDAEYKKFIDNM
jgi:DNA-directed RNA polymerase beta subunit